MASLTAIRTAIKTTAETAIPTLMVHRTIPGGVNSDALIVRPTPESTADFAVSMARGTDTWQFDLLVLVANSDLELGQDTLDAYISGAGAQSLRQIFFLHRTLGLTDGTDAYVSGASGYGTFEVGGTQHLGALLSLVVHTPGTE